MADTTPVGFDEERWKERMKAFEKAREEARKKNREEERKKNREAERNREPKNRALAPGKSRADKVAVRTRSCPTCGAARGQTCRSRR